MVRLDIPDLLEKHDSSGGLTVEEIANKTGVHHSKLAPAFQLLVSTGWFTEEGKPGEEGGVRYRNNRFTAQLKVGQHGGNWCRAS
jgi:predicted transcriptional regulator